MVQLNASDLHITVGSPPVVRLRGHLQRFDGVPSLSADETRDLLYRILSSEQQKRLEINRQLDLAHSIPGVARFRVNVFFQRETLGAAFRLIPNEIKSLEELGLSASLHQLAEKPRGLVLVTGPDRLRQVDDARVGDRRDQPDAARPHPHGRGSDRVPAPSQGLHRQPARDRRRRDVVRRGSARRAAPGPGRDPRRRDARPRDDRDRDDRGRDRPPRVRHAAHAERAGNDRPHHRRLPARAAGAGARADRRHAPGRHHPGAAADRRRARAASPRSRSCCRTTRSGT